MFDFEKLDVYNLAKTLHKSVQNYLKASPEIDKDTRSQLRRASMSICLNIAEGAGRFTKPDKRNFFVIARGSAFECASLFGLMLDEELITPDDYKTYYQQYDRLSRMLYGMINKLKKVS